jgi:hypothetical protein
MLRVHSILAIASGVFAAQVVVGDTVESVPLSCTPEELEKFVGKHVDINAPIVDADGNTVDEAADEAAIAAAETEFDRVTKRTYDNPQGKARAQLELQDELAPLRERRRRRAVRNALRSVKGEG